MPEDERFSEACENLSLDSLESQGSQESETVHQDPQPITGNQGQDDGEEENKDTELKPRASSATSRLSKKVALKDRRGLLARVSLIPEYEDARDYPKHFKLLIVFAVAFAATTGPMGTSIMLPAIDDIVSSLHTSESVVNVSVGIYMLALGIFPLWWSMFSEKHGRRSIYLISFILFLGFSIGAALSPNIASLIIFRVLCGGCSASVQAVGAGTIGDLYAPKERGAAMGLYYLGPLMGPFLAPILGGAVAQAWGWRATQWLLAISSGLNVLSILFLLPETLRKQDTLTGLRDLLRQNAEDNASDTGSDVEKLEEEGTGLTGAIPPNITNTVSNHDYDDKELRKIASRLSRRSSRTHSINSMHDNEEQWAFDNAAPTLSRLNTNKSSYSRRIIRETTQNQVEEILSEARQVDEEDEEDDNETKWQKIRKNSYEYIVRPMHSVVLLSHPPVALVISYSATCFAVIYFFNMSISNQYAKPPYSFSTIIVGLLYIPNSVTYIIASVFGGKWNDRLLRRYAQRHNGELVPEARISWNVIVAIIMYPPACLIFGWCLKYGEHWVTPLIGTALSGFASMLVIGATVTYLVDMLPGKGATGVALNNLIRQTLAAIAVFIVEPLLNAIGPGILFSILAGIITVGALPLWILKRKGSYFRKNYDLSKLYEKL
ncbi:Piso0_002327 [Millerozyma farinosa CBS 7064]|uniref:Piso0_002327 protein n=1 Tax=Pichia sorbitophila (strain ATCC MYA-4447 / BCRC 22081 / CBS 7064 / NBRC 10061 / NRRL Y-12695) TaxID=559304 RepID=G8YER5_PICSO|nr:Piso0_002327 [Millerozyma farinosa CBS 7064]